MKHARDDYQRRIQDSENLIPPDEPVFLLRGQDLCAARAVEHWAGLVELRGGDQDIVDAAKAQAEAMRIWQGTHAGKLPDLPQE